MVRSASVVIAVVVLELLLSQTSPSPSHGSSVLEAALAVLPSGPAGVAGSTVAVMTIVWLVEGGIVPSRIIVGQAPVWATVSRVQLVLVRAGSSESYRLAPTAFDGPALVTLMVNVIWLPAMTELSAVLRSATSAWVSMVTLVVELPVPPSSDVALAVLPTVAAAVLAATLNGTVIDLVVPASR